MTYIINNTNGSQFAVIADGTINTQSSMTLVGKNYAGYGQFLDENFLHLLQNGANSVPPTNPIQGQLWWNTTLNQLQIYDGTAFKTVSAATASSSAPTGNSLGDLWFDTANQQLNVWNGTVWVLIGPTSSPDQGKTGAFPLTIKDDALADRVVLGLYDANILTAITSFNATFVPQTPVPGFGNVVPGIQLAAPGSPSIPSTIAFTGNLNGTAFSALNITTSGGTVIPADQILTTGGGGGGGAITLPGDVSVVNSFGVGGAGQASGAPGTITTTGAITSGGAVNATQFNGSGAGLTNINGSQVSLVPNATNAVNATNATTATSAEAVNPNNNFQMGSLGVGTGPSGTPGTIQATNNITAYVSDDRLKTRLGNIENALEKVRGLTGFYYELNKTANDLGLTSGREIGLSAQDVHAVFPEVTAPAPIDPQYMTLHYDRITAILVEAIKEIADDLDEIKKKLG